MDNSSYQSWQSQLRKGYLELCVMLTLRQKKSSYGFELLHILKNVGLELNEGTLYPLLNRMQKNQWLDSHWETPNEGGHPRRFYQLSQAGSLQLPLMLDSYQQNTTIISQLEQLV